MLVAVLASPPESPELLDLLVYTVTVECLVDIVPCAVNKSLADLTIGELVITAFITQVGTGQE
jgi:hypothetical protein